MIELFAALIGGAATLIAALITKPKDATPGLVAQARLHPWKRILALIVVGAVAGGLLASVVVAAAEKGLLIGGFRTPVGTITAYMGNSAPEGWLPCDGTDIDKRFTELRTIVGEKTPDLRGKFLRGLDQTGKIDPDGAKRTVGSPQSDMLKDHQHYASSEGMPAAGSGFATTQTPTRANGLTTGSVAGSEANGTETRPKNVAVNYIIKY